MYFLFLSLTGLLALLAALYYVYRIGKESKEGEINEEIVKDVSIASKARRNVSVDSYRQRLWDKYHR